MTTDATSTDQSFMALAIELAKAGEGSVEPNPMVGCVIAIDGQRIGEGWHEVFGGPHAEINALASVPEQLRQQLPQATAYVTLEPCSHQGKTGPCADALIESGIGRVIVATVDPNPMVSGQGIERLRQAGVNVEVGLLEAEAKDLLAPYLMRTQHQRPWVIAKWAMSLDGKIATRTGDSQWISNSLSRQKVHLLRSRVDAIITGIGTVTADDPMLNARLDFLEEPETRPLRVAKRVVVDPSARISLESQIVKTAQTYPVLVAVSDIDDGKAKALRDAGCEIFQAARANLLAKLLQHLAETGCTNIMLECGASLMGALTDHGWVDELHLFIGPKLIGGSEALPPVGGTGPEELVQAISMTRIETELLHDDIYSVYRRPASQG